jgi:hypothetical protein
LAAARLLRIIGSIPLQRLSRRDVEGAFAVMLADGLSPVTVRNTRMVLHKSLADAVRLDRVMVNAAVGVTPPKTDRGSFRIDNFRADEAMDLWNNLQGRAIASANPKRRTGSCCRW